MNIKYYYNKLYNCGTAEEAHKVVVECFNDKEISKKDYIDFTSRVYRNMTMLDKKGLQKEASVINAEDAWNETLNRRSIRAVKERVNNLILKAINKSKSGITFKTRLETEQEDKELCRYLSSIGYSVSISNGMVTISWYQAGIKID